MISPQLSVGAANGLTIIVVWLQEKFKVAYILRAQWLRLLVFNFNCENYGGKQIVENGILQFKCANVCGSEVNYLNWIFYDVKRLEDNTIFKLGL